MLPLPPGVCLCSFDGLGSVGMQTYRLAVGSGDLCGMGELELEAPALLDGLLSAPHLGESRETESDRDKEREGENLHVHILFCNTA